MNPGLIRITMGFVLALGLASGATSLADEEEYGADSERLIENMTPEDLSSFLSMTLSSILQVVQFSVVSKAAEMQASDQSTDMPNGLDQILKSGMTFLAREKNICIEGNAGQQYSAIFKLFGLGKLGFDSVSQLFPASEEGAIFTNGLNLVKKFQTALKAEPDFFRFSLDGRDGYFNTNDTYPLMTCIPTEDIDDLVAPIIYKEVAKVADRFSARRFQPLRNVLRMVIRRIIWKVGPRKAWGMYRSMLRSKRNDVSMKAADFINDYLVTSAGMNPRTLIPNSSDPSKRPQVCDPSQPAYYWDGKAMRKWNLERQLKGYYRRPVYLDEVCEIAKIFTGKSCQVLLLETIRNKKKFTPTKAPITFGDFQVTFKEGIPVKEFYPLLSSSSLSDLQNMSPKTAIKLKIIPGSPDATRTVIDIGRQTRGDLGLWMGYFRFKPLNGNSQFYPKILSILKDGMIDRYNQTAEVKIKKDSVITAIKGVGEKEWIPLFDGIGEKLNSMVEFNEKLRTLSQSRSPKVVLQIYQPMGSAPTDGRKVRYESQPIEPEIPIKSACNQSGFENLYGKGN